MKNIPFCGFCAAVAVLCGTAFAEGEVTGKPHSLEDIEAIPYKTVNGQSITGTGDIAIPGAGDYRAAVNVADFGAVGDGVTDDTAAIAAAAGAAKAAKKPLYFPKTASGSTYLVSAPLALTDGMAVSSALGVKLKASAGDALTVGGTGVTVANLTLSAADGSGIVVSGAANVRIRDVIVSASGADGISLAGATNVWITGAAVKGAGAKGIRLGAGAQDVKIRGCLVSGSADNIFFEASAANVVIADNQITDGTNGLSGYGWHGGAPNSDVTVANNIFRACGVNLAGGLRMSFTCNTFLAFAGNAVAFKVTGEAGHPFRDSVIADNTFGSFDNAYSNPTGALVVDGAEKVVIRGNALRREAINGKAITGTGKVDIVVSKSTKVAVTGNSVEGAVDISSGNTGVTASGNAVEL